MATEQLRRLARSRDGVIELTDHVEKIWRRSRPRLMKFYDETQQTGKRTRQAAKYWLETTQDLEQHGLPYDQAYNLAMSEWVDLPDIEDGDEELIA
ncbi:MAG: hypothetical protein H8E44_03740 [Planctomycetes bacterium]|nr:hypothetical protein [Planctomycetota bacterium]